MHLPFHKKPRRESEAAEIQRLAASDAAVRQREAISAEVTEQLDWIAAHIAVLRRNGKDPT